MEYIIYKIVCKNESITDCYIGSTKNLHRRIIEHKNSYNTKNQNSNCKVYEYIRENGGWDNWDIIEIENIMCENKNSALIRERFWIEELKSKLNQRSSYERFNNKHSKTWRIKCGKYTCECGKILSRCNLARHIKTQTHIDYLSGLASGS